MVHLIGPQLRPLIPTVSVTPGSFKACLGSWLALLQTQRISAKLWVKVPRHESWLADLQHYAQTVSPAPEIYLLSRRSQPPSDWYTAVPLPNHQSLRGEYGLVVIAPTLAAMVLAQRVAAGSDPVPLREPGSAGQPSQLTLMGSVQPTAIQETLDALKGLLQDSVGERANRPDLSALLNRWDDTFALPGQVDPQVMDALMAIQWQQADRQRQQIQTLRKKALTATSLSTQNEALMTTLQLKDDFLSSAGQQLRAPLTTIKTALPLLGSPSLKPPLRQRYLDMISRECDRQSTLINGVLDLLQIEMSLATVTPTPVQIFDVVPGVVSTYQPIAQEKGVRLAYTIPDNLAQVACPESWLRQIVIHLIHNSIKYTESGGEVWVTAKGDGDDWVILDVRDTGVGIPPQEISRIFDHFHRGRQAQEDDGAGLGLTIVQQLLLYCGGKVQVDSQPGTGTQFRVRLPTVVPETGL
jgi:two-component system phosphate regulon sensor histidine kinase PhoR